LWLVTLAAVLLAAACIAVVVVLVARGEALPNAIGTVAATIGSATTVVGLIAWVWQRRRSDTTVTAEDLHEAADRLATVVRQQ
jgi:NADH:ubiquinone oxidoreductase subunit K